MLRSILPPSFYGILVLCNFSQSYESRAVLQASEGVRDFCRIGIKTATKLRRLWQKILEIDLGERGTDMFLRRRRMYLNQYYDKAIYFDRKTHELLEAPKSKLLDTEKSSRMNRHIPLLVVFFMFSGGGLTSFFSIFVQGTYSMTTFWSVILIWIAEFAFVTILVERALYRNVNRAQVTTQTVCLVTMEKSDEAKDMEAEMEMSEKDSRNATRLIKGLIFLVPLVGFFYAYDFIFNFKDLLGNPIGGEIFKIIATGLLLGVSFVLYNQNNLTKIFDILDLFRAGKLNVICRADDDPDVYLEVRMGVDQEPVITQLEKDENQVLK